MRQLVIETLQQDNELPHWLKPATSRPHKLPPWLKRATPRSKAKQKRRKAGPKVDPTFIFPTTGTRKRP
jgi:hypothetical protein